MPRSPRRRPGRRHSGNAVRVLITGAAGHHGRDTAGHDVVAVDHTALDITERDSVLELVTSSRPDAIVHAAAWTEVDACESDPDRALAVNGVGTRHVAEAARGVGRRCAHLDRLRLRRHEARALHRADEPNPQSAYGRSKLAGERELADDPTAMIVRRRGYAGTTGRNMAKTVLRLAGAHDTLRFVDDQRGHPTFADDLAGMVRRPGRRRASLRPLPRHEPGRRQLVRIRPSRVEVGGARPRPGRAPLPPPTSTRRGPRRAPRTPCSTTRRCAAPASHCSPLPANRWTGWCSSSSTWADELSYEASRARASTSVPNAVRIAR